MEFSDRPAPATVTARMRPIVLEVLMLWVSMTEAVGFPRRARRRSRSRRCRGRGRRAGDISRGFRCGSGRGVRRTRRLWPAVLLAGVRGGRFAMPSTSARPGSIGRRTDRWGTACAHSRRSVIATEAEGSAPQRSEKFCRVSTSGGFPDAEADETGAQARVHSWDIRHLQDELHRSRVLTEAP